MAADRDQPTGTSDDEQRAFSRVTVTRPQLGQSTAIPRLELTVEREDGRAGARAVVVDGDLCRIGSHPSNDLVLQDPTVSRFHCRLSRGPDAWRVSDTGSLNGTSVGGVRVREADLPLPECRLALGSSIVRVRELGSTATDTVPVWPSFGTVAGTSLVMRRLFATLARVARSDSTLLIEGESGTGKEIIATELVRLGARAGKPLVVVDCGAISPNLSLALPRRRRARRPLPDHARHATNLRRRPELYRRGVHVHNTGLQRRNPGLLSTHRHQGAGRGVHDCHSARGGLRADPPSGHPKEHACSSTRSSRQTA